MFPMIIVAHLSRSVPRKALLEMLLTGDPIDAAEAYRLGFVNRIYPDRHALEEGLDDYGPLRSQQPAGDPARAARVQPARRPARRAGSTRPRSSTCRSSSAPTSRKGRTRSSSGASRTGRATTRTLRDTQP